MVAGFVFIKLSMQFIRSVYLRVGLVPQSTAYSVCVECILNDKLYVITVMCYEFKLIIDISICQ